MTGRGLGLGNGVSAMFICASWPKRASISCLRSGIKWSTLTEVTGKEQGSIFQQPFSWKALGVDIRGRSRTLRVNYRTSHQIRTQADRLLGPVVTDVDGNSDERSDTVSVFNGPPPTIQTLKSEDEEIKAVLIGLPAIRPIAH